MIYIHFSNNGTPKERIMIDICGIQTTKIVLNTGQSDFNFRPIDFSTVNFSTGDADFNTKNRQGAISEFTIPNIIQIRIACLRTMTHRQSGINQKNDKITNFATLDINRCGKNKSFNNTINFTLLSSMILRHFKIHFCKQSIIKQIDIVIDQF